jgi:DNA-binding transcriptional regulator YhcF (GntR family)
MDIVLNRSGGVPVRDQLVTQLELKILSGDLKPGQKLPSVRSLARRLKVHANTVSAAYQDLEQIGRVDLRRGSGVFVRRDGPATLGEARGLDDMIRLALNVAFRKGYRASEIRAAVERWLAAAAPDRVVVVDPTPEMGELLVHEVRQSLGVAASACTLTQLARDPQIVSGALTLCLPYYAESVSRVAPSASIEVVTLQVADADRQLVMELPQGGIVLFVSHAPPVLPFVSVLLHSLRGDEILGEAKPLAAAKEWRRLVAVADVVFADALSVEAVGRTRPRRLKEVRILPPEVLDRIRHALTVAVPPVAPPSRRRRG